MTKDTNTDREAPNPLDNATEAELDRILEKYLPRQISVAEFKSKTYPHDANETMRGEAKAAIERLITQARIEELEHVICHKHGFGKDSCPQIKERISELQAQASKKDSGQKEVS